MDMFGSGFQRLESSLIAREKMQSSITSNIANADTPNYKADKRNFADFLADQNNLGSHSKAATTHARHFAETNTSSLLGSNIYQQENSRKIDGNSVNLQSEMARMSENQLMHELSMRLVKGRLTGLMNAIKEGR
ncbi:flagellar basal body rod protein FlgB [Mariprofundus sp. EBB-1]|uniref:flagellar basal body rod protein FlgB n=1 Tax=Mariprofundus sp. EBB-1 TaxID=2650971 RepID=UPI000EF2155A|nr:flagellar basal body rod protein FlgB [Mariprofundus sp. EBB-1]RLL53025.1 flagellar basal body rod protein FlgB [Mariprofundus sp. EBB-1]